MQRAIVSFRRDDEGDWVAGLECGHRQHVRHRPPFRLRPWVEDPEGRQSRIGTPLDCPLCDRAEVPEGLEPARTTATCHQDSLPPALLREHRVPPGMWGVLRVHSGAIRLVLTGKPGTARVLGAGAHQGIPPGLPHRLERIGPVALTIDFLRVPAPEAEDARRGGEVPADEGGDPACWANLVCPECGAVVGPDPHRPGCAAARRSGEATDRPSALPDRRRTQQGAPAAAAVDEEGPT